MFVAIKERLEELLDPQDDVTPEDDNGDDIYNTDSDTEYEKSFSEED